MKNELVPVKEGLFQKIKNWFLGIFESKKIEVIQGEIQSEVHELDKNTNFVKEIKVEVTHEPQKKMEKEEFVAQLETDKSLLQSLSIDRLKKINEYYDEMIEKEEIKLKRINQN